ncbi:hypothetical protein TNCT_165481 [Trichonephila clavata]|uniref:Uncharacterized protein n=1 Tax=Trichonephila clavata TaxID=2740835 RepID=A0A8X6FN73_TRICU|nr:hypothetical protein TNCT_165481 [Trichonephila clavata]
MIAISGVAETEEFKTNCRNSSHYQKKSHCSQKSRWLLWGGKRLNCQPPINCSRMSTTELYPGYFPSMKLTGSASELDPNLRYLISALPFLWIVMVFHPSLRKSVAVLEERFVTGKNSKGSGEED